MTTKQEIKLKMYLSTDEFLVKNEPLTKELPEFPASFSEFRNTVNQIKLINEQQENVRTGVAKDKKAIRNTLISLAADNSGKVFAYAKVTNNKELLDAVNFSISDLGRMTDVALRSYAESLNKKIQVLIQSLTKYGINAATQKKFGEVIAAYDNSFAKPRLSIAEKREVTKLMESLFISAEAQIVKLDAIIGIIRYDQVKFFNGYKTVRKLVNFSSGLVSLKAAANDLATSEPLKGAIFTFKNNGTTITKRTADKGGFYIKNMKTGTYEVLVKREGYKEKVVTVSIQDGERSELIVELEKA